MKLQDLVLTLLAASLAVVANTLPLYERQRKRKKVNMPNHMLTVKKGFYCIDSLFIFVYKFM